MTITRLEEKRLPFDEDAILSDEPEKLRDYLKRLIRILQERDEQNVQATNLIIDLDDGTAWYSSTKDSTGAYPTGTWRIIKVGSALEFQEKTTNTGVDADDWTKIASHSR